MALKSLARVCLVGFAVVGLQPLSMNLARACGNPPCDFTDPSNEEPDDKSFKDPRIPPECRKYDKGKDKDKEKDKAALEACITEYCADVKHHDNFYCQQHDKKPTPADVKKTDKKKKDVKAPDVKAPDVGPDEGKRSSGKPTEETDKSANKSTRGGGESTAGTSDAPDAGAPAPAPAPAPAQGKGIIIEMH